MSICVEETEAEEDSFSVDALVVIELAVLAVDTVMRVVLDVAAGVGLITGALAAMTGVADLGPEATVTILGLDKRGATAAVVAGRPVALRLAVALAAGLVGLGPVAEAAIVGPAALAATAVPVALTTAVVMVGCPVAFSTVEVTDALTPDADDTTEEVTSVVADTGTEVLAASPADDVAVSTTSELDAVAEVVCSVEPDTLATAIEELLVIADTSAVDATAAAVAVTGVIVSSADTAADATETMAADDGSLKTTTGVDVGPLGTAARVEARPVNGVTEVRVNPVDTLAGGDFGPTYTVTGTDSRPVARADVSPREMAGEVGVRQIDVMTEGVVGVVSPVESDALEAATTARLAAMAAIEWPAADGFTFEVEAVAAVF